MVFIADEVQTGFARTGAMFACEHEGIEPDLIVTAKGIADGLPLSAVTGRAEIMDAPHVGGLGGTFGGNPVACAAALATIETIESDGLIERAQQIERLMTERLRRLQAGDDRIGDVRGRGAMIAIELVKSGTADPDAELTEKLATALHAAGVIVLTCGMFGNIIRLLPPLTISDELLTEGIDILAGSRRPLTRRRARARALSCRADLPQPHVLRGGGGICWHNVRLGVRSVRANHLWFS